MLPPSPQVDFGSCRLKLIMLTTYSSRHMYGTLRSLCRMNTKSCAEVDPFQRLLTFFPGKFFFFSSAISVAHFNSRFGTLGVCLASFIPSGECYYTDACGTLIHAAAVIAVTSCHRLNIVQGLFFMLSLASTSLLFFLRIRAVYANERYVGLFFGLLWVAILGLSVFFVLGFHSGTCFFFRLVLVNASH